MTERHKRGQAPTPIEQSYIEMCERCDALGAQFDAAKTCEDREHAERIFLDLKSIANEWGIGIQLVEVDPDEDSQ